MGNLVQIEIMIKIEKFDKKNHHKINSAKIHIQIRIAIKQFKINLIQQTNKLN